MMFFVFMGCLLFSIFVNGALSTRPMNQLEDGGRVFAGLDTADFKKFNFYSTC